MKEKQAFHVNGYLGLLIAILGGLVGLWLIYSGFRFGHLISMIVGIVLVVLILCLLYTSPSPRDGATSRMPSSA